MPPTLGAGACRTSKPRGPARHAKPSGAGVVAGKLALELDQRGGKVGHGIALKRMFTFSRRLSLPIAGPEPEG